MRVAPGLERCIGLLEGACVVGQRACPKRLISPLTTCHVTSCMTTRTRAYQLSCLLLPLKEAIYEGRYFRYLLAHLQGQVEARVEAAPPHSACR